MNDSDSTIATNYHPKGCECGGFDRTASHSADEYAGYCANQAPSAVADADFDFLDLNAVRERLFGDNRTEFSTDVRFLHGAMVKEIEHLRAENRLLRQDVEEADATFEGLLRND